MISFVNLIQSPMDAQLRVATNLREVNHLIQCAYGNDEFESLSKKQTISARRVVGCLQSCRKYSKSTDHRRIYLFCSLTHPLTFVYYTRTNGLKIMWQHFVPCNYYNRYMYSARQPQLSCYNWSDTTVSCSAQGMLTVTSSLGGCMCVIF